MDAASFKTLIGSVQKAVPFVEVRAAPASQEYLEGVLHRQDLQRCYALLCETLGSPIKEFGKAARFDSKTQQLIQQLGGIRIDQCLFLLPCGDRQMAFAALWPWASDPTRITLKVGVSTFS